jgi:predicted metal-dependent hydrolase
MASAGLEQLPLWDERVARSGWPVRRSQRARRLAVRVFRDGSVEIVVPHSARAAQVADFVSRHRAWIERQQRRLAPVTPVFPPETLELAALGEHWQCVASPLAGAGATVDASARIGGRGAFLRVQRESPGGGALWLPSGLAIERQREQLLAWLVQRAAEAFEGPLHRQAAAMGLTVRRLQVRRQRTRWGSCSSRGTISLNVSLLFQPPEVVQYLFVHELTHMRHMNHSARFWAAVAAIEPHWRELDRRLTQGWQCVPGWLLAALRA